MSISQAIKDFPVIRSLYRLVSHNSATGRLQIGGTNIDPYEFTWEQFILLTASDYAGINVRVTDRHQDSRGVGGVLFVGGTSWTLISPQIYYATFAAAIAAVPAASWSRLAITCGDVGLGMVRLISNATRYIPVNGTGMLAGGSYGTIAAPTNTLTAAGEFPTSAPTIPANLLAVGDRLRLNLRFNKSAANGAYYVRGVLGSTVDVGNAMIYEATSASTATGFQINAEVVIVVASSTVLVTNRGFTLAGAGSAPAAYDVTTNFNIASPMLLGLWLGSIIAGDTAALLSYSLRWEV